MKVRVVKISIKSKLIQTLSVTSFSAGSKVTELSNYLNEGCWEKIGQSIQEWT